MLRHFNRDAANNEIGMQAVEFTGDNVDGDGDGVVNELTVGDITALTVYLAAQPRPTTKMELSSLNLIDPLSSAEVAAIGAGARVFNNDQVLLVSRSSADSERPGFQRAEPQRQLPG